MKLLCVLLCTIPFFVFGQGKFLSGYVIHPGGGREFGQIEISKGDEALRLCRFRENSKSVVKEFSPKQIEGYAFLSGRALVSVPLEGGATYYFLRKLVTGRLSLFQGADKYFLLREDSALLQITRKHHRNQLKELLSDCPSLRDQFAYFQFSEESLNRLVRDFNQCLQVGTSKFVSSKHKKEVSFSLLSGIEWSSVLHNTTESSAWYITQTAFYDRNRMQYGAQFSYGVFPRLDIQLGYTVKPKEFLATTTNLESQQVTEFSYAYTESQMQFNLQYTLLTKELWMLYTDGGVALPFLTTPSSNKREETNASGIVTTLVSQPVNNVTKSLQYKVGFGAAFMFTDRLRGFANASVFFGSGTLEINEITSNFIVNSSYTAINLSFGIGYKL